MAVFKGMTCFSSKQGECSQASVLTEHVVLAGRCEGRTSKLPDGQPQWMAERLCVRVCLREVRGETERPSSPPASCAPRRPVIKIKAVVMGYSFWPLPVAYPFNGACVRGKKLLEPMREVDRKKEIKKEVGLAQVGGVSSELFAPRCSDGRKGREEEETRGHLKQRLSRGRVRGRRVGGSPIKSTHTRTHAKALMMDGNETKPTLTIDSWWMIPSATLHSDLARGNPGDLVVEGASGEGSPGNHIGYTFTHQYTGSVSHLLQRHSD